MAVTRISDIIVPAIFTPYVSKLTSEKSRILRSGAVVQSARLTALLSGEGLTFQERFYKDLDNTDENISTDDPTQFSTPNKISSGSEIQVRLSRNNSWSTMDLINELISAKPAEEIAGKVSGYWERRMQKLLVATGNGIVANNATATDAYHVQNDMVFDVSMLAATPGDYEAGLTDFTTSAFIDAVGTMGDSMDELELTVVHSVVYNRMLKQQLIEFIPDAINMNAAPNTLGGRGIPTFLGRNIIVDDGMPNSAGVFETWIFGRGAFQMGMGTPAVPTEVDRIPSAGMGAGQEILHSRVEWCLHPVGYAYIGVPPAGGPSNAATSNNLANAASWRRMQERKQTPMAVLRTREY